MEPEPEPGPELQQGNGEPSAQWGAVSGTQRRGHVAVVSPPAPASPRHATPPRERSSQRRTKTPPRGAAEATEAAPAPRGTTPQRPQAVSDLPEGEAQRPQWLSEELRLGTAQRYASSTGTGWVSYAREAGDHGEKAGQHKAAGEWWDQGALMDEEDLMEADMDSADGARGLPLAHWWRDASEAKVDEHGVAHKIQKKREVTRLDMIQTRQKLQADHPGANIIIDHLEMVAKGSIAVAVVGTNTSDADSQQKHVQVALKRAVRLGSSRAGAPAAAAKPQLVIHSISSSTTAVSSSPGARDQAKDQVGTLRLPSTQARKVVVRVDFSVTVEGNEDMAIVAAQNVRRLSVLLKEELSAAGSAATGCMKVEAAAPIFSTTVHYTCDVGTSFVIGNEADTKPAPQGPGGLPPALPHQKQKYLDSKPVYRCVKPIQHIPTEVQAVLAQSSGPDFGFVDKEDLNQAEATAPEQFSDSVLDRSCFVFGEQNRVRIECRRMAAHWLFEALVLGLIGANSVTLAMYDPLNPDSDENEMLDDLGKIFTLLFAIEMFIKMIAMGVIFGEGAYLRESGWNWVDFVVVVSGFTDFIPNYDNQLGVFRTIRLLRPLRTITSVRGMRVLVGTLLQPDTLAGIGNVCLLCCFIFVVAGIIGVNLFAGTLQARCFDEATLTLVSDDQMCTIDGSSYTCAEDQLCSKCDPITGVVNDNPNGNMVQFDNFIYAVLTVFTMLTLEGWTDVMYAVQDGFTSFSWIYFVILITFGTFIGVNLFLAVISAGYEKIAEEVDEEQTMKDQAELLLRYLKEEIHKSLNREHEPYGGSNKDHRTKLHDNDVVRLTPAAVQRWADRGRGNLTESSNGTVVALDPSEEGQEPTRARVRVGADYLAASSTGWRKTHAEGHIESFWFPVGDLERVAQTAADQQKERVAKQKWTSEFEHVKEKRERNFFKMFDKDGSDAITRTEFVKGLAQLSEANIITDASGNEPVPSKDRPEKIFIADKSMRALLFLVTNNKAKGNDKIWQQTMQTNMFELLDDDASGQITMTEFKHHFYDTSQWTAAQPMPQLACFDLKGDEIAGLECTQIMTLYCKWLCEKKWFTDFISAVVLINCIVLGADRYGQSPDTENMLEIINTLCTVVFIVELVIKLVGLGYQGYVSDSMNIFDGFIVFASVVEWFLPDGDAGGISVFRALRILRIVKLTQSMDNFKRVLNTILSILPEMSNFFALLMLFVFFFAVMGQHLWGGSFTAELFEEHPKSNFDSFGDSLMAVFQVLTGENWNSLMYDVITANGQFGPVLYFVLLNILGVYVMLNLFLAVLLLKTTEAFMPQRDPREDVLQRARAHKKADVEEEEEEDEFVLESRSLFIFGPHSKVRESLRVLVKTAAFDNLILLSIIFSSLALAVEEPGQDKDLIDILELLDLMFTGLFVFEMIAKIVVLCFIHGTQYAYLRNGWNVLDFAVVCASVTSIILKESNISWVRGFRVFRALRPLRVIKRVPELRVVVNSLFRSVPTIANVMILLGMLWMIFGILGVQLFKGTFYFCTDSTKVGMYDCVGTDVVAGAITEVKWDKPPGWGFDNLGQAVITLFEVSTLEMWLDIMYMASDATEPGLQPEPGPTKLAVTIYFVLFIFIGSFFIMELFVGATVTSYNLLNAESQGSAFQSERQKKQVAKIVLKDTSDVYEAQYDWQLGLYQIAHSSLVENVIMLCIVLNILLMALSQDDMSDDYTATLDLFNDIFTFIFAAEAVIKIGGEFPSLYFRQPWNQYDFFVVAVTLTEFTYTRIDPSGEIPGASILRVFRIARIFRLLRKLKGLTKLFLTVAHALPTMLNVGGLLVLLFFIYAVLGMHLFGRVKRREFLNDHANFESFGSSLLLVFRMSTGESWNGVMNECRITEDCSDTENTFNDGLGNCGSPIALVYFLSFQLIGQYVMLNLFIAVMLEYYQREQDASDPALTTQDNKTFETVWTDIVGREAKFPNRSCQLMPVQLFDDFMERLPPHIGWTHAERMSGHRKMSALQAHPFNRLKVRALKLVVPWRTGMQRYIDGVARFNDRQLKQGAGVVSAPPADDSEEVADLDEDEPSFASLWTSGTKYVPARIVNGEVEGDGYQSGDGTTKTGSVLTNSYVRPRDPQLREPGVRFRCVSAAADAETSKGTLAAVLQTPSKAVKPEGEEEDDKSGDTEPDWKLLAERSTPAKRVILKDNGVYWEREDPEVRLMERFGLMEYQLPRTSTIEMHYYHMTEVWHCLYERAEMRHLQDPENVDIRDEGARERRIGILEDIMNSTYKDVRRKVSSEADFDSSIREAKCTPYDNFTAMRVQQHHRRRHKLRQKRQREVQDHTDSEARIYARKLLDLVQSEEGVQRQEGVEGPRSISASAAVEVARKMARGHSSG